MKNALKLILLIFIFSFLLDKAVYWTIRKMGDQVYSGEAVGKLNHYLLLKDSVDIIIFGSSRTNHHLQLDYFPSSTFNMGVDGTALVYCKALIKLLPPKKPQRVILHVDTRLAFDPEYTGFDIEPLKIKYHQIPALRREIDQHLAINPLQKLYWTLDYNGITLGLVKNYLQPKYNYQTYDGYDPLFPNQVQKEIFKGILKQVDSTQCEDSLRLSPTFRNSFEEIQSFCQENNKTLVVFTSPLYRDPCLEDNKLFAEELSKMGITYYDFSTLFGENSSLDYWKDLRHLAHPGAEIFSKIFADTLGISL